MEHELIESLLEYLATKHHTIDHSSVCHTLFSSNGDSTIKYVFDKLESHELIEIKATISGKFASKYVSITHKGTDVYNGGGWKEYIANLNNERSAEKSRKEAEHQANLVAVSAHELNKQNAKLAQDALDHSKRTSTRNLILGILMAIIAAFQAYLLYKEYKDNPTDEIKTSPVKHENLPKLIPSKN